MNDDDKSILAARAFTEEERKESSTWRELTAFRDTWTNPKVLAKFAGTGIVHDTVNEAMVHVIATGSRNRRLHPLVVKTVLALRNHGENLSPPSCYPTFPHTELGWQGTRLFILSPGNKMMAVWKSRND